MTEPSTHLELDRAGHEAMIRVGIPTLTVMFAENRVGIHGNGRVDTKAGLLGGIGSGKTNAIDCTDETVRFCGGLTLLSAVATMTAEIAREAP